jgi:glycosyltransferase involved in cell wall biosynthesis
MKLVYIATDPLTVFRLMDGQLRYMREQGFDVTVIAAPGPQLERAAAREGVRAIAVPMRRDLSPLQDAVALARLMAVLKRLQPTIVNAGTPKAGLLGVIAARAVGVPHVVYLLRGLRFEGARGAKRLLLAGTEHVAGGLAHRVFANSRSLKDRYVALGCARPSKVWVPGAGSSNGVDVARFEPTPERRAWGAEERARRGFAEDAIVVGFVGRFARDKGLSELTRAFQLAAAKEPRLRLLLVGDHDATDPVDDDVRRFIAHDARVSCSAFVDEPARFYSVMSLLAFPSFREGLPNVPLEAAAAGLPVVAFRATGTVDAIVHEVTGTLVSPGDVPGLAEAMLRYAKEPARMRQHGEQAHQRVVAEFRREIVWQRLAEQYRQMVAVA